MAHNPFSTLTWTDFGSQLNPSLPRLQIKSYLLAGIAASGDDGDTADLEELHFILRCGGRVWIVEEGEGGYREIRRTSQEVSRDFGRIFFLFVG